MTQKATVTEDESPNPAFSDSALAEEFALWDRTMGCQIRTTRDIKKGDVLMRIPRKAMITPDLIENSDVGVAFHQCLETENNIDGDVQSKIKLWDRLGNSGEMIEQNIEQLSNQKATQLLVKILQWRKKAEQKYVTALKAIDSGGEIQEFSHCTGSSLSTRAPFLAFLISQRFSNLDRPPVLTASTQSASDTSEKEISGDVGANPNPPSLSSVTTFAPYVRSIPSFISLPICWKRNQLALLSSSISGSSILQEVAAHTLLLSNEYCSLIDAGILTRFPSLFPRGSFTWENYVWACTSFMSRALPMEICTSISNDFDEIQQYHSVWNDLGVLVPFLDMLNHERESNQVTWETSPTLGDGSEKDDNKTEVDVNEYPRAVAHRRIKKSAQVYTNYGSKPNSVLLFDYGFAQISNADDRLGGIGWVLSDCVLREQNESSPYYECGECTDVQKVRAWWDKERLELLSKQALRGDVDLVSKLCSGQQLVNELFRDGTFSPILLTASLIGTMPPASVKCNVDLDEQNISTKIKVSKKHQISLRIFLKNYLESKMNKLLSNLSNGLRAHYKHVTIWSKIQEGGLKYQASEGTSNVIGWQGFFDMHAYRTSIEIEKRYYAMGADSCVLALFDGHLKSIQTCIDKTDEGSFQTILDQLSDLGFDIIEGDVESEEDKDSLKEAQANENKEDLKVIEENKSEQTESIKSSGEDKKTDRSGVEIVNATKIKNNLVKSRSPALKLHIGNLAYSTTPPKLFDYFSEIFGMENVIECHVPTEKGTGRSRGFGFVTLPESVAMQALEPERTYNIEGRLCKIAKSNSKSSNQKKSSAGNQSNSGRCPKCGFRPKYCDCSQKIRFPPAGNPYGPPTGIYFHPDRSGPDRSGGPYVDRYDRPYGRMHPDDLRRGRSPSPRSRNYLHDHDYDRRSSQRSFDGGWRRSRSVSRSRRNGEFEGVDRGRKSRRSRSRSLSRSYDKESRRDKGRSRVKRSWSRSPSRDRREKSRNGNVNRLSDVRKRDRDEAKRSRNGDDKRSISSDVSRERSKRKKKRKSGRRERRSRRRNRSISNDRRSKSNSFDSPAKS